MLLEVCSASKNETAHPFREYLNKYRASDILLALERLVFSRDEECKEAM